jgi:hypothetical protein
MTSNKKKIAGGAAVYVDRIPDDLRADLMARRDIESLIDPKESPLNRDRDSQLLLQRVAGYCGQFVPDTRLDVFLAFAKPSRAAMTDATVLAHVRVVAREANSKRAVEVIARNFTEAKRQQIERAIPGIKVTLDFVAGSVERVELIPAFDYPGRPSPSSSPKRKSAWARQKKLRELRETNAKEHEIKGGGNNV